MYNMEDVHKIYLMQPPSFLGLVWKIVTVLKYFCSIPWKLKNIYNNDIQYVGMDHSKCIKIQTIEKKTRTGKITFQLDKTTIIIMVIIR